MELTLLLSFSQRVDASESIWHQGSIMSDWDKGILVPYTFERFRSFLGIFPLVFFLAFHFHLKINTSGIYSLMTQCDYFNEHEHKQTVQLLNTAIWVLIFLFLSSWFLCLVCFCSDVLKCFCLPFSCLFMLPFFPSKSITLFLLDCLSFPC